MTSMLVWGAGPYHSMRPQVELFRQLLSPLGFDLTYLDDRSAFDEEVLSRADIFLMMGADWSVINSLKSGDWEESSKTRSYTPLGEKHWRSFKNYLNEGKALFCHHTGLLSFDERTELEDIYDGRWIVGQSSHPPNHEFKVELADKAHPITRGLEDFKTFDELYTDLNNPKHSEVLLRTHYQGKDRPLAWVGRHGGSKIACSALGHDLKSYDAPQMRKFFVNTVQWLVSK